MQSCKILKTEIWKIKDAHRCTKYLIMIIKN